MSTPASCNSSDRTGGGRQYRGICMALSMISQPFTLAA